MSEKLTKIMFAQLAGYIAKNAATWSAGSLDLIEEYPEMLPDTVFRFTDGMRERLDRIDALAGRAALHKDAPDD